MSAPSFTKWHGPTVERDSRRLEALAQVCRQVEGVTTAAVRQVDFRRQEIVYEYLELATPLGRITRNSDVFALAGRLLARMHMARLSIDEFDFSPKPYPLTSIGVATADAVSLEHALPPGWFHADFWHGNVFALPDGRIAVIDPIPPAGFFPRKYILACGALDVAMMYMTLLTVNPLVTQLTMSVSERLEAAETFLAAYLRARNAYSEGVVASVRRVAHHLSEAWVRRSAGRLAYPVHILKKIAITKTVSTVDRVVGWRK